MPDDKPTMAQEHRANRLAETFGLASYHELYNPVRLALSRKLNDEECERLCMLIEELINRELEFWVEGICLDENNKEATNRDIVAEVKLLRDQRKARTS